MLKRLLLAVITTFIFQLSFAQDALFLKTPLNGQVLSGGEYFNITWESSNVENIKIEYSLDGGTNWKLIIDSYAAQAGSYRWNVPAKPTTKGKIRISDIDNSSIASVNSGSFTISEPQLSFDIDLTAALVKDNAFRIGWKSLSVEKVNLYYSIDNGSNYTVIRKGFPALASSFIWIVPQLSSNKLSLKIESADSAAINSVWENAPLISNVIPLKNKYQGGSFDGHSSASNTVPKLSLTFPAGNEDLASSSIQTIKWSSSNIEYLKVEFSADDGISWQIINDSYPAYAKKLDWKVPSVTTGKGIIRLTSIESENLKAANPIPFRIPLKSIAITESFESFYLPQQPIQISWINNGVDFISLQYRNGNATGWNTITKSVSANLLNFIWIPPVNLTSDSLQFKISSIDHLVQDSSKNLLSIKAISGSIAKFKGGSFDGSSQSSNIKPTIEILTPAAGTTLNGFANTSISWKSSNIESVSIQLSTDSGKTWKEVIKNYAGSALKYPWTVPTEPTKNGILKISSSEDSTIKSLSGRFSIIEGFVKLTTDSVFKGGINEILPISWVQSGISKVNVLIRPKTAGSIWTKILRNYEAAAGSYLWIINQPLTGLHSIKIENVNGSGISDSVDINFHPVLKVPTVAKYKGGSYDGHSSRSNISKILITKPQAGEVLIGGSTYSITWSTVNVADSVKIEYTTDNGQTWKTISLAVDSKTGIYLWTVPTNPSGTKSSYNKNSGNFISSLNDCKIRISETGSQDEVVGISNNTFAISVSAGNYEEIPRTNFTIKTTGESCKTSNNGKIEIKAMKPLNYTATFNGNGYSKVIPFTNQLEVTDLHAGNYSLCITIEGQKDFGLCYDLVITEPQDLVVYATVKSKDLNLILAGGDSYFIEVNGQRYTTTQNQFTVALKNGNNAVSVSTEAQCQGVFNRLFRLEAEVFIYPNPFDNILKLNFAPDLKKANIIITDVSGKTVYTGPKNSTDNLVEINLSKLISGAYFLKLLTEDSETVYKILKR